MEILAPLFGIFTSIILFYYLSSLNRSNLFLALFFLCCNLIVLVYFGLHFTKSLFWEGVCFVNFLPLSYLLGPLMFYYVKNTVSENKKFNKIDLLHLLPALLTVLACLPYTTLPFEEKMQIAHQIVNITEVYNVDFNWVSFEFILFSRSLHLLIYAILSIVYFTWYKNKLLKKYGSLPSNHQVIKRWIYTLVFIQFAIAINSLGHMTTIYQHEFKILGLKSTEIFSDLYYFRICGGGFFIQNFILFLFPKVLYGNISFDEGNNHVPFYQEFKSNLPKKTKSSTINEDFNSILNSYLMELPFIKKDFSLSQMSFDLKIPERFLSNYFNNDLDKTFGEWKNDLRIAHVCQMIADGKAKVFTIEAIATNAGFVSRSKFIDAFKARNGVTPSVFIKNAELQVN